MIVRRAKQTTGPDHPSDYGPHESQKTRERERGVALERPPLSLCSAIESINRDRFSGEPFGIRDVQFD
jgi:hypothetical protein